MKLSELQAALEAVRQQHGDIWVDATTVGGWFGTSDLGEPVLKVEPGRRWIGYDDKRQCGIYRDGAYLVIEGKS